MKTINQFTPDQEEKISELAKSFDKKLANGTQGKIENEDVFEKKGLHQQLQESDAFRADFIGRAVSKVRCSPE